MISNNPLLLKGGSFSKTEVLGAPNSLVVRKSVSTINNREYGYVRLESQLRKLYLLSKYFPYITPPVLSVGADDKLFFYEIPYYQNYLTCHQAISASIDTNLILESLVSFFDCCTHVTYPNPIGSLSAYIYSEMVNPIRCACKILTESSTHNLSKAELAIFLGIASKAIDNLIHIANHFQKYQIFQSLNHGNLTLENMLWDTTQKSLILIDPYAETICESLLGDLSQIYQSCHSYYEIITSRFSNDLMVPLEFPTYLANPALDSFARNLASELSSYSWYDESVLRVFWASQFTRMFYFKHGKNSRLAFLFLQHGIDIISEL